MFEKAQFKTEPWKTTQKETRKAIRNEVQNAQVATPLPLMVLTVPQVAEVLQISRTNAYELVKEPGFPVTTIRKRKRVSYALLEEWVKEKCKAENSVLLKEDAPDSA